jgi:hypothetical protein
VVGTSNTDYINYSDRKQAHSDRRFDSEIVAAMLEDSQDRIWIAGEKVSAYSRDASTLSAKRTVRSALCAPSRNHRRGQSVANAVGSSDSNKWFIEVKFRWSSDWASLSMLAVADDRLAGHG